MAKNEVAKFGVKEEQVNAIAMALGAGVGVLDMPRITWPGLPAKGVAPTWAIEAPMAEDGGGTEVQPYFDGVLLALMRGRVYYGQPYSGVSGVLPDCTSTDRRVGVGKPGGHCSECHLQRNGCRTVTWALVLREGMFLPTLLQVPPTSVGIIERYEISVAAHWGVRLYQIVTRFGLQVHTTTNGRTVSQLALRVKSRDSGLSLERGAETEELLLRSLRAELLGQDTEAPSD